ncbi:MAG: TrbG/VirB9 family P-type conjugative transfer protein [Gemmatimonadota bacterium]|nr:TrbG/VirB9 family P-type conjugative transfer protein [Gemmatimonadota bacterium]
MTTRLLATTLLSLSPVSLAGQDPPPPPLPPAIPPQENILFLEDTPETTVFELSTRIRHTTIITLPPHENILDFVVGDQEYWHLTGAANVAFLKPIAVAAATNIALVCASGRIYSFLVRESTADEPHLVVRIGAAPGIPADPAAAAFPDGGHEPAFVARDRVRGYEVLAEQAQLEIAQVRAEAVQDVDAFREDYPTRLRFAYSLPRQAHEWPWRIEGMWHDGNFTFVRSNAQETPAIYEEKDGEPSLVPYDLQADGLFVIRRLIGDGWFQLGRERLPWRFTPPEA